MKHCSWCDKEFKTDISYQIYCSVECRNYSTKEKIAQRYLLTRRQKRKGKMRTCKSCKGQLSIYNDDSLCSNCLINPSDVSQALKEIKGKINGTK